MPVSVARSAGSPRVHRAAGRSLLIREGRRSLLHNQASGWRPIQDDQLFRAATVASAPDTGKACTSALPYTGGCTNDCSGHEAGARWAEQRWIEGPDDCSGNSNSFIEGCQEYAADLQRDKIQSGQCEDEDYDELCDY